MLVQTSGGQIIVLLPLFYILRIYPEQTVQYLA